MRYLDNNEVFGCFKPREIFKDPKQVEFER
jgi:hypothetical protein